MRRALLLPLLLGVAGCVPDGGYYDAPPRGGYYGAPYGGGYSSAPYGGGYYGGSSRPYYPRSSHDGGQCTFQTRRGALPGYRPPGKDRCCIDTPNGRSCQ
jgi:hypothetical protein